MHSWKKYTDCFVVVKNIFPRTEVNIEEYRVKVSSLEFLS